VKLKPEVNPSALRPELLLALVIAERIFQEFNYDFVVTSLNDSIHSDTSLHYAGAAVDLRTRHMKDDKHIVTEKIRSSLTKDYDVILELDHIHIEYQPRR